MTIKDVISEFDEANYKNNKLITIHILSTIRGGGLQEAKDMIDSFPFTGLSGKDIIKYLKENDNWVNIKKNIKRLKYI